MKFKIESENIKDKDVIISYCIPSYNHSKYIIKLLDSIEKDSCNLPFNFEVLIFDDGSTDETKNVLRNYIDHTNLPIKVMFFDNVGISNNLNRIKKYCNGKWIRLCASDDLIITGSTLKMLNARDDKTLCIIADGNVIDSNNNKLTDSLIKFHKGNKLRLLDNNKIVSEIICNYSLAGPCLLINASVYDFYKYDPLSSIDDYDFFVSLLLNCDNSIKFLDELVCNYRIHDSNTSKTEDISSRIKNQKSMLLLVNKFLKYKKHKNMFRLKKLEIISKLIFLNILKKV